MTNTYRRTGRVVTITGLGALQVGAVYIVNATGDELRLEEVEPETVLPMLGLVHVGAYAIDPSRRSVVSDAGDVDLTKTEWRVMECLLRRAGQVVPYELMLREAWRDEAWADTQALRVWVSRLRHKLPGIPIRTVESLGYMLALPEPAEVPV